MKHGGVWGAQDLQDLLNAFAKLHLVNLLNSGGSIECFAFKLQCHKVCKVMGFHIRLMSVS